MKTKTLKKIRASRVTVFKIRNRRGYAAVCLNNLTEGGSAGQALARLKYPLRRMGYQLDPAGK
jgi:hypothetical protein